ncbi:hypothetical protein BAUCODRAFT_72958 [Baudoinia panamericana UAMH 10762]|uniref:CNH domain-containing protein n=1 Tax=Baudoinia panamericana (strain UAMH 10762) TaxID=717646 RepID=M2LL03_BAUPA|nr:uncharacterized protein BAUCODRAFT_72958 [Baudoinia panamericana UAMH 10762]EMC94962.1 hypothetical protein BAUCODRAFT_72958 [Baudoinia panamericana UAMH 10762]
MLSAFRPEAIHEFKQRDKSKVESLLAYGDRLLVGLNTGSLRIYRVNENAGQEAATLEANGQDDDGTSTATAKPKAVELLREEEKFSRKPVQQLAMIKEANLLVSLSDGYVSLHDLQTRQLVERLERTKGAVCFTTTSNVVKEDPDAPPSLVSRLAVGVKRKALVWTWRDMEMESSGPLEIATEATVKNLIWVQGKGGVVRLVVGMDAGFSILNPEAGNPEEDARSVYKPASRQDATSGELAGVRFGAVSSSGMGYMGMGSWVPKPMATGLSEGQILLAKDVNTLFTDLDGHPLEKRQVPWAMAPEAVGFSYPYLLALQPPEKGTLQIRNPDTLSLLQTISIPGAAILHVPQPNISLAHAGKGFIVASDRTIWRMNALPYDTQVQELVEKHRFDEAVSLLDLLEDTLIDDKAGRIREVKMQKATHLFQQQKYRAALDLFTEAEAPPARVIALYPQSIAGDLSSVPEATTDGEEVGEDDSKPEETPVKEPHSTPQKGVLGKLKAGHARRDSDAASTRNTPRADSDNMSIRTSKIPPAKPTDRPLEGDDLKIAVRCLCSFLAQARVQIQKYLTTQGALKENPPELDPETDKPAFANLLPTDIFTTATYNPKTLDWQKELLETAKLVDTTLFRAYMLALPSLAGPLFRLDNFCDPDVVQASLYEHERYGDLIDFLHGKRLHRQVLEMLTKFGKGEADAEATPDDMKGPDRTIAYLKQLPPELVDLVLEFVRWPVDESPSEAMDVFVADTDHAERMPRKKVLKFLEGIDKERGDGKLEMQYLEHVVNEWGDQTPEFNQQLVELYLARLKAQEAASAEREELQRKLEAFLRRSRTYNQSATFRQLPADDATFFESRAIVLKAMGNHKQALSIYVFQIKDSARAEQYCNEVYLFEQHRDKDLCLIDGITPHEKATYGTGFESEDAANQPNVFALLLGLYLRPPPGEEKRWPEALELLSRHGARLPASSTLNLMPDDLAIKELQDYFRGRIRNATSILRQTSVIKSLSAVQRVNTERQWLLGADQVVDAGGKGGRNRRVRITEEDHCRVCHKRFGASAIRVNPDNTVVHYGCVGKKPSEAGPTTAGRRASAQRGWN